MKSSLVTIARITLEQEFELLKVSLDASRSEKLPDAVAAQTSVLLGLAQHLEKEISTELRRAEALVSRGRTQSASILLRLLETELLPLFRELVNFTDQIFRLRADPTICTIDEAVRDISDAMSVQLRAAQVTFSVQPIRPLIHCVRPSVRLAELLPFQVVLPRQANAPWKALLSLPPVFEHLIGAPDLSRELGTLFSEISAQNSLDQASESLLRQWASQMVAEIAATLVAGPSFVTARVTERLYGAEEALAFDSVPPFLRWLVATEVLQAVGFGQEAQQILKSITELYGPRAFSLQFSNNEARLAEITEITGALICAVLETPLLTLGGLRFPDMLPRMTVDDHQRYSRLAAERNSGSLIDGIKAPIGKLCLMRIMADLEMAANARESYGQPSDEFASTSTCPEDVSVKATAPINGFAAHPS